MVLVGGFAALCLGEVHSESWKSHCHGVVKCWVVGLRRCARGRCIQELQIAM